MDLDIGLYAAAVNAETFLSALASAFLVNTIVEAFVAAVFEADPFDDWFNFCENFFVLAVSNAPVSSCSLVVINGFLWDVGSLMVLRGRS